MPKVTSHTFTHEGPDGERKHFSSEVYVDSEGTFSCTVPEDLVPSLSKLKSSTQGTFKLKVHYRAYASTLPALKHFVYAAMEDAYSVEQHEELIIAYSWFSEVSFFIGPDGTLYENGAAPGLQVGAGTWANNKTRVGNGINATNPVDHFSVGLFAAPFRKTTFTRKSGKTYQYQRLHGSNAALRGYPWAERLAGFCSLSCSRAADKMDHMPLTEDAAKFFFDSMMSMCDIGRRFAQFFSEKENVMAAIAGTGPALLTRQGN